MSEVKTQSQPDILIIAGMHRSGTSLAASLLQSAGVNIGKELLSASHANAKGHFENLDFVNFHREVLRSQGLEDAGWTLQSNLEVSEQQTQLAQQIIAQNATGLIWGWKDPRTTLFLDFWMELLPAANFLLLYRSPWEVVDSLLRRSIKDLDLFLKSPDLAIKIWTHYNRQVLDFCQRYPHKVLLVGAQTLTHQPIEIFTKLNEKFGLTLPYPDLTIYDQSLLHTENLISYKPLITAFHVPEAIEVYQTLLMHEAQSQAQAAEIEQLQTLHSHADGAWIFQSWLDHLQLNAKSKSLESKLQSLQAELVTKNEALFTKNEALFNAHACIENQQQEIHQLHVALQSTKTLIAAMETSKFWQLRQAWFRLKKLIGFDRDR